MRSSDSAQRGMVAPAQRFNRRFRTRAALQVSMRLILLAAVLLTLLPTAAAASPVATDEGS